MNSWLKMWQLPFANFDQNINPVTTWFSPQYSVNIKGDPAIEAEIQTQVASFGSQLGSLMDAVLELAGDTAGEKLDCLRQLQHQVEDVKVRHSREQCERLRVELGKLKQSDPAAFAALIQNIGPV